MVRRKATVVQTEPAPTPKPETTKPEYLTVETGFPETPQFVGWTYSAQEIEDFRKVYKQFVMKYNEARKR